MRVIKLKMRKGKMRERECEDAIGSETLNRTLTGI